MAPIYLTRALVDYKIVLQLQLRLYEFHLFVLNFSQYLIKWIPASWTHLLKSELLLYEEKITSKGKGLQLKYLKTLDKFLQVEFHCIYFIMEYLSEDFVYELMPEASVTKNDSH